MAQSTITTLITRCCVTATILTRYAALYSEWKPQARYTILSLIIMVRKIITEIFTRCAVKGNYSYHISGLPP